MSELLVARKIVQTYHTGGNRLEILKGVDFAVKANETIAVLGVSGSGKSTLLHILATMDQPTSGELTFNNENLLTLSERARNRIRNRDFGFVFQFHHLLPDFNALENVMMPGVICGTWGLRGKLRKKAAELLARVGLAERLKHKPRELSGGERQRVAIARALVNQPRIIFCDEPTGNLDAGYCEEFLSLLLGLSVDFGTSSVIVTHDTDVAQKADRMVYLQDGILHQKGPEADTTKDAQS